jgi:hypothetical protein
LKNTFETFYNNLISKKYIISIYLIIAIFTGFKQCYRDKYNNYKIFKYTYYHLIGQTSLYKEYPNQHLDSNHYGPVFSVFIAPFAVLPDIYGSVLWNITNAILFLCGIYCLPLFQKLRGFIALLCLHEVLGAFLSFQFNVGLTGLILLSFSYILRNKVILATLFIAIGFLIKLYGIIGLAFFFFTKKKLKFIFAGVFCLTLLFFLPALFSSIQFNYQSYLDWYASLTFKNEINASLTSGQDISLMGMVHRITQNITIPNWPFILSGIILFALPYLRISQYKFLMFRLMLLASALIFVVIFSSSSESPTYVIAFTGVVIWFAIQPNPKNNWIIALFIFAFLLTSLSPSDLFPRFIREQYVWKYSLKALPCVIIWFVMIYQMLTVDFELRTLKIEE